MRLLFILFGTLLVDNVLLQSVTKKENKILSRKKRFLVFPQGSNLQVSLSGLKDIMLQVPKGFRAIIECDVQFNLPSKSFKSYVKDLTMHTRHRREVFDGISKVFNTFDLNGEACLKKIMCEAQYLEKVKENSLFHQLIYAVFMQPLSEISPETKTECNSYDSECDISWLGFLLDHIYNYN